MGYVADRVSGQRWVSLKALESIALGSHLAGSACPPRGPKGAASYLPPERRLYGNQETSREWQKGRAFAAAGTFQGGGSLEGERTGPSSTGLEGPVDGGGEG